MRISWQHFGSKSEPESYSLGHNCCCIVVVVCIRSLNDASICCSLNIQLVHIIGVALSGAI
jgi:hypothetical protein